jgi:hypothetical protein
VTLVCRGDKRQRTGARPADADWSPYPRPSILWNCRWPIPRARKFRDVIPANTLAAGAFSYAIAVDCAEGGERGASSSSNRPYGHGFAWAWGFRRCSFPGRFRSRR